MQSSDNVVSRIIDLDAGAEKILAQAHEEVESIRRETKRSLEEQNTKLETRIAEKKALIETDAVGKRNSEIVQVRKEYSDQAAAAGGISPVEMERIVDVVLTRIKGTAE